MVWIYFFGLNLMYYDKNAIKTIVVVLGHPIKVDVTIKTVERRQFTGSLCGD